MSRESTNLTGALQAYLRNVGMREDADLAALREETAHHPWAGMQIAPEQGQLMALLMLSLVGVGVVAALSAALYAALPRYFLECAELHGRFRGLRQDEVTSTGTPTEALPEGVLAGQPA